MTAQQRGQRTRERVLDAALPLLAERGSDVRIEDIRDASGVSVGSIYHHFGNRDNIVVTIYAESLAQLLAGIAERVVACQTAQDGVNTFVETYLTWLDNHHDRAQVIFSIGQFRVDHDAIIRSGQAKAASLAQISSWYNARVSRGEVRAIDGRILEVVLAGPLAEYWRRRDAGLLNEIDDRTARSFLAAAAWRVVAP